MHMTKEVLRQARGCCRHTLVRGSRPTPNRQAATCANWTRLLDQIADEFRIYPVTPRGSLFMTQLDAKSSRIDTFILRFHAMCRTSVRCGTASSSTTRAI